jgi:hypothetical protein
VLYVFVFEGRYLLRGNGAARGCHQFGVQAQLGLARLLDRMQLRPQVVRPQEIVRDPQPAGRVAL